MANRLSQESSLILNNENDQFDWWSWDLKLYKEQEMKTNLSFSLSVFLPVIGVMSCRKKLSITLRSRSSSTKTLSILKLTEMNFQTSIIITSVPHKFLPNKAVSLFQLFFSKTVDLFCRDLFSPRNRGENTGLLELGTELARAYREEKDKVLENADQVSEKIKAGLVPFEKVEFEGHYPPPNAILNAIEQFRDKENGGYGEAPKFPQLAFSEWAIEQMLEGMVEKEFGESVIQTLENMMMGGIFDHARGGLHRYSTDAAWHTPHFEKMLYDQAGILRVLSKLSLLYPSPLIYDGLIMTLDYLHSEMLSEKGYFFTSQDAESEGVEGLYQCFTEAEFEDAINHFETEENKLSEKMDQLKTIFCIKKEGNFHSDLNIPQLNRDKKSEIFTQENWDLVRDGRKAMLEARKLRMPPVTDTKGIASWNFNMISALVDVMHYCRLDIVRRMASNLFNKCMEGVFETFIKKDEQGRMRILHSTSRPDSLPYLEDYTSFAECQLRFYELTGKPVFKDNFRDTMKYIEKEFLDEDKLHYRAKFADDFEPYPNLVLTHQDMNYRSPTATVQLSP